MILLIQLKYRNKYSMKSYKKVNKFSINIKRLNFKNNKSNDNYKNNNKF